MTVLGQVIESSLSAIFTSIVASGGPSQEYIDEARAFIYALRESEEMHDAIVSAVWDIASATLEGPPGADEKQQLAESLFGAFSSVGWCACATMVSMPSLKKLYALKARERSRIPVKMQLRERAEKLFSEYNSRYFGGRLPQYRIRIVSRIPGIPSAIAYCSERSRREILLVSWLHASRLEAVLLHEMAHVSTNRRHGPRWMREMTRLRDGGALVNPEECQRAYTRKPD